MDIILPAHGGGIAQYSGRLLDRLDDVRLEVALAFARGAPCEQQRGPHGCRPGSEVLGRELFADGGSQVLVDRSGVHRLPGSGWVHVLKKLFPGNIATSPDDAREPWVGDLDLVLLAALSSKAKTDTSARHLHVPVTHGGEAISIILTRVFRIANTDEGFLEKAHHGG